MKVTKKVSAIAAVVGVCILATTSFAVYNTGNGYDNLNLRYKFSKKYADGVYFIPLSSLTKSASPLTESTVM